MANSTMVGNRIISFKELTTNPKLPKNSLGFAGITYIPGVSDTLKGQLKKHAPHLKLAFRPASKVAQLFSDMKEKVDKGQQSNVVYSIPCKMCSGKHFGEMSQKLCIRCGQHRKDVENANKMPGKTALVAHAMKAKHEFDFEEAAIMKKVRSKGLLKIHEANQIILHEEVAVNFKKDAKHVSPVFYNLIKKSEKLGKKRRTVNPSHLPPYQRNDSSITSTSEPTERSGIIVPIV